MEKIARITVPARDAGLTATLAAVRSTRLIAEAAEYVAVAQHRGAVVGNGQ